MFFSSTLVFIRGNIILLIKKKKDEPKKSSKYKKRLTRFDNINRNARTHNLKLELIITT